MPEEFKRNARRFLYYQLFRSSLSFEDYLQDGYRKGYVKLRPFSWQALLPERSATIQTLLRGIVGLDANQAARLRTKEGESSEQFFFTEEEQ